MSPQETPGLPEGMALPMGPSRRWYALAAMLWTIGWLAFYSVGYAARADLDSRAADFAAGAPGDVLRVTASAPGTYVVWLEVHSGRDHGPALAEELTAPRFLPPVVARTDTDAEPAVGGDYRSTRNGEQVQGYAVASVDLPQGTHRIRLPLPDAVARDEALLGFAVAPENDGPGAVSLLLPATLAVTGGLAWLVVVRRRGAAAAAMAAPVTTDGERGS